MIWALLLAAASPFGTVTGAIKLDGPPRSLPPVKIDKDASLCGREAAADVLVVGKDRALANVVVSLKGVPVKTPPPPSAGAAVDQVGCRYTPHVQAVTVGTTLAVLNSDAVLHNVHGVQETRGAPLTVFNLAMPFKGKLPTVLRRPGAIRLRCDAGHTWMSAYVHVFEHPFFAVTDERGRFAIKDVPPGKYILQLWHEPLDGKGKAVVRELPVMVRAGQQSGTEATITL